MTVILYFILLIIAVYILIDSIKKDKNLLGTVFFAVFILYYILTPAILGLYDTSTLSGIKNAPHLYVYANATEIEKLRAFVITLFATVLLIALRRVRYSLGKKGKNYYGTSEYRNLKYDYDKVDNIVYKMGIVFLIVGGLSLFELTYELGGVRSMLSVGSTIRGYIVSNENYLSSIGAICKTLSVFVTGSFFCFYSSNPTHRRHTLLTVLSLILSVIYLLFNAGRGPLVLFFACLFFAIVKERGRKVIWLVVLGMIFIFFVSSSLEVVMNNVSRGLPAFYNLEYNVSDNLFSTISDLAFPSANVIELPKIVAKSGYSFGVDYILWFSEIIPKRLLSFFWNLLPTRILVTTKVSQYYIQLGLSNGGTPADFITFGWFQGSIIGLIVNCILYDAILKNFNDKLSLLPKQYSIIKYRMCFFAFSLITSNDLPVMLKSNLFLIIMMIVIGRALRKCSSE
jgi:hypothetical protein